MALKQHEIEPVLHLVLLLQTKNRVAENVIHFHEEDKKKKMLLLNCVSTDNKTKAINIKCT